MDVYRHHLRWFAGTALVVVALVGGLNLFVDPYNRFGLNRLGVYISAEREFKTTEFPRFAPDAVLLGSSRAAMIDVSQLPGYRFFNAGFGGAKIEEMGAFIERFVTRQKLVVLSLDAGDFGVRSQSAPDPFEPLTLSRACGYILNLRNVEFSVRTVAKSLGGEPSDFAPNGTFSDAKWAVQADRPDEELNRRRVRELCDSLARHRLDPAHLEVLRAIRDTLQRRGIELRAYLAPIQADVWRGLEGTDGLAEIRRTAVAIKGILPQTVDLSRSEYSAPEGFYRSDPVHFRSAVGVKLLQQAILAPEKAP